MHIAIPDLTPHQASAFMVSFPLELFTLSVDKMEPIYHVHTETSLQCILDMMNVYKC